MCIGGLYKGKGQRDIILACSELLKRGVQEFHVNLVGKGDMQQEYEQLILEHQLRGKITLCGAHRNVKPFYKNADVMIMSSVAEAFGRTTVEAMMGGCAVIGANAGATPEIVNYGDCGYLYESGNYNDLADKMEYVISNKSNMFEKAIKGQNYALENYTAKLNTERIADLYKTVGKI